MAPNPYCNGDPRRGPDGTESQALDDRDESGVDIYDDAPFDPIRASDNA